MVSLINVPKDAAWDMFLPLSPDYQSDLARDKTWSKDPERKALEGQVGLDLFDEDIRDMQ